MSLGELLGSSLRDKDLMKNDLTPSQGDVATVTFFLNDSLTIKEKRLKAHTRTIEDSFIVGHPNNAILGTSKLGDRRGAAILIYDSGEL